MTVPDPDDIPTLPVAGTTATATVTLLLAELGAWRSEAVEAIDTPDDLAVVVEAIHGSFTEVLTWVTLTPDRCMEAGHWWGRSVVEDLGLALPDLVALTEQVVRPAALLRAVPPLVGRGWLSLVGTWWVSPARPGQPSHRD